ncbi:MAG: hypothetical protein E7605_04125 [Ruminococcaceae bacterium]|nr:hypothetical protein [Oscillospiraceae bacterium]
MKKRIVAAFMLLAMLVAMIPSAFAADETAQSVVLRDLKSMTFDGEPWSIEDYPVKTSDVGCYCIAVDEVGFRKDGNLNNYAFYIYVYNPSGQEIVSTSASNRVQMAVAWNDDGSPSEYEKFKMTLISVSSEAGYENVFYKFRVEDRVCIYDGLTMKQRLLQNKSRREYDVSGFELLMKQSNEIKDHAVGCNVIVRGYDAGCGDGNAESTKEIRYVAQQTLTLEVQQAYWRTQSSSKGVNHKHQINSAYFSIPNEVWDQYKELYSIKCEWEEHHTTPMIVTDDHELYETLMNARGIPINSMEGFPSMYSNLQGPFTVMRPVLPGSLTNVPYTYTTCNYAFNPQSTTATLNLEMQKQLLYLTWVFESKAEIELGKESVSAQEVLDFYNKYGSSILSERNLLLDEVDEGREDFQNGMTIYFDTTFDLSNYKSTHNWLQKIIDYNPINGGLSLKGFAVDTDEVYPTFIPIDVFEKGDTDVREMCDGQYTNEYIAETYFFNDTNQAVKFLKFVNDSMANNETVVLFRYASTDYFSESLTVYPEIEGHAYIATQTFFKNFDVIQLQFKAEDMSISTVAVVSDPSHGIGGIQGPTTSTDPDLVKGQNEKEWEEILESLKKILKWLVIILVVSALTPLVIMAVNMLLNLFTGESSGNGRTNYSRRRRK